VEGFSFEQIVAHRTGEGTQSECEGAWAPAEWFGPPDGELGEAVPLSVVLGRSERAVVALRSATAYSTGSALHFVAVARGLAQRETRRLIDDQQLAGDDDEVPDTFLRVGFEFANGVGVSNLGLVQPLPDSAVEPNSPVLSPTSGSGGHVGDSGFDVRLSYWLWPLPPPGPLRVFVEWPALGIGLTSLELDAQPLRDAAERSRALWDE
jgi:hypothetical protein